MPVSVGAPRQLLRRLREVMAERESAQARLDKVVVLIASNMVAEVCSLYLRRRDGSLELFATEGLNPGAVHNTHLKSGEGLVGLIAQQAEPMQFPDAQHHPAFSYRPETGEEIYHSFVGVPILRGGHTIGVLTVQNRTKRQYSDEEIEALQTTAMVLAEMIASGGLVSDEVSTEGRRDVAARFTGLPISEGVALGHVVLHEPRIVVTRLIAEDVELERRRLGQAIEDLTGAIDSMMERGDMARAGEHREVLEAFRMFAHDHGWRRRLDEALHHRPDRRGRGAARAQRHARAHAALARSAGCASGCTISTICPIGCCGCCRAASARRRPAACRRTPSWSPAPWGPPSCSTTTGSACAGWCWRRAVRRAMSPSSPARSASRR